MNQSTEKVIAHKLVILGDVAVGKSSIAQRYFNKWNRFVNSKFLNVHEPTIGKLFYIKRGIIPYKKNSC